MSALVQTNFNEGVADLELLKRTYGKGLNDDEWRLFCRVSKHTGLDPSMKQIYPVMRQGKLTIQTGIDGYRLIAERTGRYSPGREPTFTYNDKGGIISATAYVMKMTPDGRWHEVAATAFYDEYYVGVSPFWKKMPHGQLAKCAEALALRKAFPAEMAGTYTSDEMDNPVSVQEASQAVELLDAEDEDFPSEEAPLAELVERLQVVLTSGDVDGFLLPYLEYCQPMVPKGSTLEKQVDKWISSPEKFLRCYRGWVEKRLKSLAKTNQ